MRWELYRYKDFRKCTELSENDVLFAKLNVPYVNSNLFILSDSNVFNFSLNVFCIANIRLNNIGLKY